MRSLSTRDNADGGIDFLLQTMSVFVRNRYQRPARDRTRSPRRSVKRWRVAGFLLRAFWGNRGWKTQPR